MFTSNLGTPISPNPDNFSSQVVRKTHPTKTNLLLWHRLGSLCYQFKAQRRRTHGSAPTALVSPFPGDLFGQTARGRAGSSRPRPGYPCGPRPPAPRGRTPTGVIYRESGKNRGVPARASQIPGLAAGGLQRNHHLAQKRRGAIGAGRVVQREGDDVGGAAPPEGFPVQLRHGRSLIRVRLSSRSDNARRLRSSRLFS